MCGANESCRRCFCLDLGKEAVVLLTYLRCHEQTPWAKPVTCLTGRGNYPVSLCFWYFPSNTMSSFSAFSLKTKHFLKSRMLKFGQGQGRPTALLGYLVDKCQKNSHVRLTPSLPASFSLAIALWGVICWT